MTEIVIPCLQLDEAQRRTLHEMGIHHSHPSVRQRAQAQQQLACGETIAAVAATFLKRGTRMNVNGKITFNL